MITEAGENPEKNEMHHRKTKSTDKLIEGNVTDYRNMPKIL